MGNQASKVIEKSKERKEKRTTKNNRRRSTITLGGKSHSSIVKSHRHHQLAANYDWVDENDYPIQLIHTMPTPTKSRRQSHYLLKSARKSNTWVTLEDDMTIVDVGTGNGIWALEIASENTKTNVIGLDIRPPSEHQQGKPKNLHFCEADITEVWPLDSNSVDFIFQRSMGQSIQRDQWQLVLSEMLRVLKPGGTIELVEADLWHHNPGPVQRAFDEFYQSQCTENNLDFAFTESITKELESSGFEAIDYRTLDIPIGEWPQESGKMTSFTKAKAVSFLLLFF
ncbi:MAG: S-adenosyl-L-methionine-dependent methyltransferase [Benjaminiella poitrasii]|nr:MAG: S-adenosyl-L-methionine-dependent methyltransferase [Benjaminiella poitrasii]